MKPMGGCKELDWEDKSERLDRRLGEGEINADGLSLGGGACGYVFWCCVLGRTWKSTLLFEFEVVRLLPNGLLNSGLIGLRGLSSGSSGVSIDFIVCCHE